MISISHNRPTADFIGRGFLIQTVTDKLPRRQTRQTRFVGHFRDNPGTNGKTHQQPSTFTQVFHIISVLHLNAITETTVIIIETWLNSASWTSTGRHRSLSARSKNFYTMTDYYCYYWLVLLLFTTFIFYLFKWPIFQRSLPVILDPQRTSGDCWCKICWRLYTAFHLKVISWKSLLWYT